MGKYSFKDIRENAALHNSNTVRERDKLKLIRTSLWPFSLSWHRVSCDLHCRSKQDCNRY